MPGLKPTPDQNQASQAQWIRRQRRRLTGAITLADTRLGFKLTFPTDHSCFIPLSMACDSVPIL
jgi:hypothetical protein